MPSWRAWTFTVGLVAVYAVVPGTVGAIQAWLGPRLRETTAPLVFAALWVLAEALRLAEVALANSSRESPDLLDTLAAAYASAGRFEEAAEAARRAADLARASGDAAYARRIEHRLGGYLQGRAWREHT